MTGRTAKCDRTKREIKLLDGAFVAIVSTGEWSFVEAEAAEGYPYGIAIAQLMRSPEALIDFLAHINEKPWFDAVKFAYFFTRFRRENNLFQSM